MNNTYKNLIKKLVEEVIEEMSTSAGSPIPASKGAYGKGGINKMRKIAAASYPGGGKVVGETPSDNTSVEEGDGSLPTVRREVKIMENDTNLQSLAKEILKEIGISRTMIELNNKNSSIPETFDGFPRGAGGSMSPGRPPIEEEIATNSRVDIINLFRNFKTGLEKQENDMMGKLSANLKKEFLNKNVTIKASKGSIGQIEKNYNLTVKDADIRHIGEKYYVVFIGIDTSDDKNKEFYLTDSAIQINAPETPAPQQDNTGGIVNQPVIGMASKRNIVPQK